MVQWSKRSKRKPTGGILRSVNARDKKLYERGGILAETKIGSEKKKVGKGMGGKLKVKLLQSKEANIFDEKGNVRKCEIVTVKENLANKLFVRRNIMTKGAIIEVKHGAENRLAKVTNRPGQSGTIEAVLLSEEDSKQYLKERKQKEDKTPQKADKAQNTEKEA